MSKAGNVKQKKEMQCSVYCNYFPNMDCDCWEYDETLSYIKRRKDKKEFICALDGHKITDWYKNKCPLQQHDD